MTKKNIRPQQVAPVERETTSTAKDQSGLVTPLAISVILTNINKPLILNIFIL